MGFVRRSPLVGDDLLDIWQRVARDRGFALADSKLDRIEFRANQLAEHPGLGPARPDIGADARCLVVERWLVLYRKTADGVEIVRIVDGARDLRRQWDGE